MKENIRVQPEIIEPEILDENGQSVSAPAAPSAHGDVYGRVGFLTGFFALAFTCVMMLLGALLTIFIIAPILLLGHILGLQIKSFRS
jgi:hypothetical protein